MGIARVLSEWEQQDYNIMIWADAKAALGMIERSGTGKVHHIDVGIFWLQQKWLKKQITIEQSCGNREHLWLTN